VVCRCIGDGGTSQYRPSLSATLRYGTQLGTGSASSIGLYGNCLCCDDSLKADVEKAELMQQVLVLMSSAAFAVTYYTTADQSEER